MHYLALFVTDANDDHLAIIEHVAKSWELSDPQWCDWYTIGGRWENLLVRHDGSTCDSELMCNLNMSSSRIQTRAMYSNAWLHPLWIMGDGRLAEDDQRTFDAIARHLSNCDPSITRLTLVDFHV